MNKRGLSQVVTSVLIILLVVSSIGVIWFFVRPLLNSISGIGSEDLTLNYDIIDAEINSELRFVDVVVQRKTGEGNVSALKIILYDVTGQSVDFRSDISLMELETRTIRVDYSNKGVVDIRQIGVAPIFFVSGRERVGSITDIYSFFQNDFTEEELGNNFVFSLDSDGFIRELNWTYDGSNWKRIIWAEHGRVPTWRKVYLHSFIGNDGRDDGWKYYVGDGWPIPSDSLFTHERHSNIDYSLVSSSNDSIVLKAETSVLEIEDTIIFLGNSVRIDISIRNKLNDNLIVKVPVQFGGLEFDSSSRYRLKADRGGNILQFPDVHGGETVSSSYPYKIGSFSPVSAVWDSSHTIGLQYVTEINLPDYVEFSENAKDRTNTKMKSTITAQIPANSIKTFSVFFRVAEGSGNWINALSPYKNWFDSYYTSEMNYCPTGPFSYYIGRNSNRYNQITKRWNLGTTIEQIYQSHASLSRLQELGMKFFVFHSGISTHGSHLNSSLYTPDWNFPNGVSFNPTTELVDPNIDVAIDPSKLTQFISQYNLQNINTIWYSRPCAEIYGANIIYHSNGDSDWTEGEDYTFVRGTPSYVDGNDLRIQENIEKHYQRIKFYVQHGAKGFYFDATGCPGDEEFFEYVERRILQEEGVELVNFQEGARDRNALHRPQIPIVHSGDLAHSNLLFWLVPQASYYRGKKWGANDLTDKEVEYIIGLGYQPIISQSLGNLNQEEINQAKEWICESYNNQYSRWASYGDGLNCPVPAKPSYC